MIASIADGDCEDSQTAMSEDLLAAVNVDDCVFKVGNCKELVKEYPLKEGAVMIADTGRYAGLVMQVGSASGISRIFSQTVASEACCGRLPPW
eukprot:COSAG06_NODE_41284_length_393_cov_0.598639_1_plen_92_part_10